VIRFTDIAVGQRCGERPGRCAPLGDSSRCGGGMGDRDRQPLGLDKTRDGRGSSARRPHPMRGEGSAVALHQTMPPLIRQQCGPLINAAPGASGVNNRHSRKRPARPQFAIPVNLASPDRRPDLGDRTGLHTPTSLCRCRRSPPSWPGDSTPTPPSCASAGNHGVVIVEVLEGSPAEKGGLEPCT